MLVFRGGYVSIMNHDIDMEAPATPYPEEGENQYFIIARPTLEEADLERSTYGGRNPGVQAVAVAGATRQVPATVARDP